MSTFDTLVDKVDKWYNKPAVQNVINTADLSAGIYGITGKSSDAGIGAGYGAWIQSVTGKLPKVRKVSDKHAQLYMTDEQTKAMHQYLDQQVISALTPGKKAPTLDIGFAPVIKPWAIKYTAPVVIGTLIAGMIAGSLLKGRF